ncbi:hypothetical protein JCM8547_005284 [Rhodosporidiobolus lusitaniae]
MATFQGQKTALLTGGSAGLGLATLEILLSQGLNVVALQRTETPELTALASKYPGVLLISKGDVTKDEDNKAAVEAAMQSFGRLDALILNAGTLHPVSSIANLTQTSGKLDEFRQLMEVNFVSLVSILTHAIPYLNERDGKELKDGEPAGRVVLVSSGAATGGVTGWAGYSASKAAMNSLGRTLGNEEKDIVTVAIRPGTPDTQMQTTIREIGASHMSASDHSRFLTLHSEGKLLPPHEPGGVLAGAAINAPKEWSGSFRNWNDEEVLALQMKKREEQKKGLNRQSVNR